MDEKDLEKLKKDYKNGLTYKQIQDKYKITPNQLRWCIQKNNWKRKSNRSKTHIGNKNAKGNKGGSAPKDNKNAVTTGEYENLLNSVLDEEEQKLMKSDFLETRAAIKYELKLAYIRKKRMLKRIEELKNKNRELVITKMTKGTENTSTEAQNTLLLISKIEDGLTRVQESIRRLLDLLDKIEAREGKYSDSGKSLADEIQAAYNERVGGNNAK